MKTYPSHRKVVVTCIAALCAVLGHAAQADPVWHCSRSSVKVADVSDNFSLAGLGLDREYIQISLRDLFMVYQGHAVSLSGQPLSACVVKNSDLTHEAMASLGMPDGQVYLSKRVRIVNDVKSMEKCIADHHPAIGYLPQETVTQAIGPCF